MRFSNKGQGALEFLTTYGWAFLVVLVLIGALSSFGVFGDVGVDKCVSGQGFTCESSLVTDASQKFRFKNTLGTDVSVVNASATVKSTGETVNCDVPSGSVSDGSSFEVSCQGGLTEGVRENLDVQFTYYSTGSSEQYSKPVFVDVSDRVESSQEFADAGGVSNIGGSSSEQNQYLDVNFTHGPAVVMIANSISFTEGIIYDYRVESVDFGQLISNGTWLPYESVTVSGDIPPGLNFPGVGVRSSAPGNDCDYDRLHAGRICIWGQPTTPGTYNITVTVIDAAGNTDSKSSTWTVQQAPNLQFYTSTPTFTHDYPYSVTRSFSAYGGYQPYDWIVSDLPEGLSFEYYNPSSTTRSSYMFGKQSGEILPELGTFNVNVSVTDALGTTTNRTFQVIIN